MFVCTDVYYYGQWPSQQACGMLIYMFAGSDKDSVLSQSVAVLDLLNLARVVAKSD